MTIATYINPPDLMSNPAFTQAIRVPAGADILYIGGQNGLDSSRELVGTDLKSQTRQALANVESCLRAVGANIENVVKWTILIKAGEPLQDGFAAFQEVWGTRPNPPAITAAFVAGLGVPGAVVEIEAVAAIPAA
ncbi:RidA family protein [Nocardia sp. NPDC006044]|uniref:RidA family protein n=1 Tax=Nocardia sp. NPDC006044 TaxID=3364306 RepID=UPI0036924527